MHTKRVCPRLSAFEIWYEVSSYRFKSTDKVSLEMYLPDIKVKHYRTYRADQLHCVSHLIDNPSVVHLSFQIISCECKIYGKLNYVTNIYSS